jgi:phosphoglycerol transferase MdoB-like AlkP superfamily enzyme
MQKLRSAILLFGFLLLVYTGFRLCFYFIYFKGSVPGIWQLVKIFYRGFRMDISALFYINLPFFLYYFFLHEVITRVKAIIVAVALFAISNIPFIAINILDMAYYRFNLRRSNVDLFSVGGDSFNAFVSSLTGYWYLLLLFVLLGWLTIRVSKKILKSETVSLEKNSRAKFVRNGLLGLTWILLTGICARGINSRPILPSTPLLYLPAQYHSLVNNSSITMLYSLARKQTRVQEKNYFTAVKLDTIFNIQKKHIDTAAFNKMNVVLFIMESFGQDYLDSSSWLRASTPFLDSIQKQSIVCNNAYANGSESNKGIVALLGSIPPFFDEPFYSSPYNGNRLAGIGNLLKEEGYSTHFFMGAEKDHFGFGTFGKMLGIDNYISKEDYGNNFHDDGNWGIYDHYFLPFTASKLKQVKQPFFASTFTISTHFPHKIPDSLQTKFQLPGQNLAQASISYLDFSLKQFFESIKNESWYQNTLFIFAADHNVWWYAKQKACYYKCFRIPLFFHMPGKPNYLPVNQVTQQLDVVPTILQLLHYNKPFMSFGKSVLDTISSNGWAYNKANGVYQLINKDYILGYNETTESPTYFYKYRSDTALNYNLLASETEAEIAQKSKMLQFIRAVIQRYNHSLIYDELGIRSR